MPLALETRDKTDRSLFLISEDSVLRKIHFRLCLRMALQESHMVFPDAAVDPWC